MNYKFDYFKFTIKPNFEYNNILAFADWIICDLLHMNEKFYDFKVTKAGGFYGQKYSYHNIYIKTPLPYKLDEGFEVEMTGGGFDYYVEFMKSNNPDFKIRRFFSDICSLRENNLYKITFDLLVIDDLSVERDTPYMQEIVYNVVDMRSRKNKPMVITANFTPADIKNTQEQWQKRVFSRILGSCIPYAVVGSDRRRQKGKNSYSERISRILNYRESV